MTVPVDVAIVTADRPQMLARVLRSLGQIGAASEAIAAVTVIDGSRDRICERRNAAAMKEVAAECPWVTHHLTRTRWRKLVKRLSGNAASDAGSSDVSRGAIVPGGIGASRNVAALFLAGRDFVFVDDDVLLRGWESPHREERLVVGGHYDPQDLTVFESRREALQCLRPAHTEGGLHTGRCFASPSSPSLCCL